MVESVAVNGKDYVADEIPMDDVTVRVGLWPGGHAELYLNRSEINL